MTFRWEQIPHNNVFLDKRDVKSYCGHDTVNSKSWKPSVKNPCYKWSIFCGHRNLYFLDCRQKTELLMRKLGWIWTQLVVSGGAERRRRTTRCCFSKGLEDVIVWTISENIECISVEIFVNIPSIKNIPQRQFSGHILNWESLHKLHIWNPNWNSFY